MTAMLEMRGVSKSFAGVQALRDVNFTVEAGEIHALVGENGAGKSTLMKVLSGVYPHGSYEGSIVFDGEERRFRDINDSEALGIIIIHQELALIPLMSIAENIFLVASAVAAWRDRPRHGLSPHQGTAGAGRACENRRIRWSPISASASSNWSRSPRRCPRRCGC